MLSMEEIEAIVKRVSNQKTFNIAMAAQNSAHRDVLKLIHPLKQVEVDAIITLAEKSPCIQWIIIFGSSTSVRCHPFSDLDICIKFKYLTPKRDKREFKKEFYPLVENVDYFDYDALSSCGNEAFLEEVMKGVIIYGNIA